MWVPSMGGWGQRPGGAVREFQRQGGRLADGRLDRALLSHLEEAYSARWQGELAAGAARARIKVITVALGGGLPLGQGLAEKTAGEYLEIPKVEDLAGVFERLSSALSPAVEVPASPAPAAPAIQAPQAVEDIWLWIGFTLFILLMLALDLGLFQRRPHVISMKEALAWFAVWTSLAILFNIGIVLFYERGLEAGLEFFTGFLVEKSLSIDNIFVFILIFNYFHVPPVYQHKVLFWGIVGAIVLRAGFIVGGLALMKRFHWTIYLFDTFELDTEKVELRKDGARIDS